MLRPPIRSTHPPFCKTCPQIIECNAYLLQCPSDPRRSACYDTYIKLLEDKLTELHTHPDLHQTIMHLLSYALQIPTCSSPPSNTSYTHQSQIGIALFMKGHWSKSFQSQQERFYRSQHRPPSFTGTKWMHLILSMIFDQIQQVWQCRNSQTHGADGALQDQYRREQLITRIDAIYGQIPNLLAHDRDVFQSLPRSDLLSGPTLTLATWLRMAEPTVQRCLADAKEKLRTNQRDIRDFLDDASYVQSHASDTTLTFDTLDSNGTTASSGTIIFNSPPHSRSSSLSSIDSFNPPSSETTSTGTDESGRHPY